MPDQAAVKKQGTLLIIRAVACLYMALLATGAACCFEECTVPNQEMAQFEVWDGASVQLTGHHRLNQNHEMLRHLIDMRNPYIDPVNVLQVEILKRLRTDPEDQGLRDALLVTINGIASGMRNTG